MSTRRVHAEAVILHKERLMNMQINVSIEEFTLRITYIYIYTGRLYRFGSQS